MRYGDESERKKAIEDKVWLSELILRFPPDKARAIQMIANAPLKKLKYFY